MDHSFDPNGVGVNNGNYFGFPFSPEEGKLVLLSVPWDATTSYRRGTANGPRSIIEASVQLDFFDEDVSEAWNLGIATLPLNEEMEQWNEQASAASEEVIDALENGQALTSDLKAKVVQVNQWSNQVGSWVKEESAQWLNRGKLVGLVGGEHSCPLGLMKALGDIHPEYGILQIDAHADLRPAYEGFTYSHASIMYNMLKEVSSVKKLVQVGIRDFCEQEWHLIQEDNRIQAFTDRSLKKALLEGESWKTCVDRIISALPDKVYLSVDIDGLDPSLCPHTGTPVPGGLSYDQLTYLIQSIPMAGKQIIGFDLCEVSPDNHGEWDQNVGARLLYFLANRTLLSKA
ncbi:agmatinase family protein [bacterium SCSIO 12741]|nr:agmatinase family protein [bacterium SCSIO 12741]